MRTRNVNELRAIHAKKGHKFQIKNGQYIGNYYKLTNTDKLETTPKGLETDIPRFDADGNYKGLGTGYTAYIHPDQYLKLVGRGDVVGSKDVVKEKQERISTAKRIGMPMVTIDPDTKRIVLQEGRHTTTALSNLGVKVMPITVTGTGGRNVKHIPFDEIKEHKINQWNNKKFKTKITLVNND